MALFLKNTTAVPQTWKGLLIAPGAYRDLNRRERVALGTDSVTLQAIANGDALVASENDGSGDVVDVNHSISILRDDAPQRDEEGATVIRAKMAPFGWQFQMMWFEIQTSVLDSDYQNDFTDVPTGFLDVKFFNTSDVELTTQAQLNTDCVKTVIDVEPTFDYELLAGTVRVGAAPNSSQDLRMWIVAVPDVPFAFGGEKVFVNGVNLRFFAQNERMEVDGRTPKLLKFDAVNHTNKLRFIIRHEIGVKQRLIFSMEYYRP